MVRIAESLKVTAGDGFSVAPGQQQPAASFQSFYFCSTTSLLLRRTTQKYTAITLSMLTNPIAIPTSMDNPPAKVKKGHLAQT
jgi:hypothetical protein